MGLRIQAIGTVIVLGMVMSLCYLEPAMAQGDGSQDATRGDVMEDLKATSRKSIQWWDSNFQVDPDSLFAPGYVNYQEPLAADGGEKGVTLDELKAIVTSYHSAFPGTKVDFQIQVVEGDRVVTHWTFTGTQKGTYEGLAPTNKTVTWAGISIDQYDADGRITQTWVVWDKFTLFSDLGLIK
jgi:predicted ester cyclase